MNSFTVEPLAKETSEKLGESLVIPLYKLASPFQLASSVTLRLSPAYLTKAVTERPDLPMGMPSKLVQSSGLRGLIPVPSDSGESYPWESPRRSWVYMQALLLALDTSPRYNRSSRAGWKTLVRFLSKLEPWGGTSGFSTFALYCGMGTALVTATELGSVLCTSCNQLPGKHKRSPSCNSTIRRPSGIFAWTASGDMKTGWLPFFASGLEFGGKNQKTFRPLSKTIHARLGGVPSW